MPVNYIPTLQNPLAGSNLPNIAHALKSPQSNQLSPILAQSNEDLQKGISGAIPDNFKLSGGLGFNPLSQGSFINPNALFPYGFNASGAPTGTDPTINPLGD